MILTEEEMREDDERWARCNVETELIYGGGNVKDRKSITNDDIRFYAWLCRAALKRLEDAAPVIRCGDCQSYYSGVCTRFNDITIADDVVTENDFCSRATKRTEQ